VHEREVYLFYKQKKGNPDLLNGKVIVYTLIDENESGQGKSGLQDLVNNGILAVSGDFAKYFNVKEFLKKELGINFEKGIEELLSKISGEDPFSSYIHPDRLNEKLKSLKHLEDFIPTPVQPESFSSEGEILSREADIYYVGKFSNVNNANIAVNSFAIFYQMHYREQQKKVVSLEIEKLLNDVSQRYQPEENFKDFKGNLESHLQQRLIPEIYYNRDNKVEQEKSFERLRNFMRGYKFSQDVESIIALMKSTIVEDKKRNTIIELYVKKICALLTLENLPT